MYSVQRIVPQPFLNKRRCPLLPSGALAGSRCPTSIEPPSYSRTQQRRLVHALGASGSSALESHHWLGEEPCGCPHTTLDYVQEYRWKPSQGLSLHRRHFQHCRAQAGLAQLASTVASRGAGPSGRSARETGGGGLRIDERHFVRRHLLRLFNTANSRGLVGYS